MSELQRHALGLVERAVRRHVQRVQPTRVQPSAVRTLGELVRAIPLSKTAEDRFVDGLVAWLGAGRAMYEAGMTDGEAWRLCARPWLRSLVGWYALTELGHAAGELGYATLADAWNAHWDGCEEARS